jgi:signal transduction histidine kinase
MNASKKILAGMSHEIRTYMNSIVSYSFLNDDKSRQNSNDAKYANIIFNTCTQVLSLMENYLQSTLIDRENPKVVLEKCSPAGIIDELIPLFTTA